MNIQKTFIPYFINLYEGTLGKVTRKSIFQILKFVSQLKNPDLNSKESQTLLLNHNHSRKMSTEVSAEKKIL